MPVLKRLQDEGKYQKFTNALGIDKYIPGNPVEQAFANDVEVLNLIRTLAKFRSAEFQTAGRGRLDRTFEAPKGSALLFSFYIQPQRNRDDWGWIPLIAGYSVAKTLHAFHATLKWPNDILIQNKKVSGLIAEVVGDGVVIGIGINVGMSEDQLPVETATSLLVEGGVDLTRDEILCEVLEEFEDHFLQWDQGIDEVQALYVHLCGTLGKEVRVEYPGGATHLAIAESISDIGALILDDGTHVQSADVIHLR